MTSTEIASASKIMLGTTEAVAMYIGSTLIWLKSGGELQEHDYSLDYFTIESLLDNNTITASRVNISTLPDIYYSFDSGETWSNLKLLTGTITFGTINTGEKIIFKCTINNWATAWDTYNKFNGSKNFKAYGNTMSLLYGDNFINNSEFPINSTHNLCALFRDSTNLIDASDLILPATIGTASCYNGMFRGATNLSHGPKELPATSLLLDSYSSMFEGCINLEEAPIIHATTFGGTGSMMRMFCMSRSSKLTTPKLTKGPILPASYISLNAYKEMFKGNGNLIEVTCLLSNILGTSDWLTNCSDTGVFKKASGASWATGTSGIPSGWTVVDYVES